MPSATEDTDDSTELRPRRMQKWDAASAWARQNKSIFVDEPETISPLMLAKSKDVEDFSLDSSTRHHNAYLAKRISSRKSSTSSSPSVWQSQAKSLSESHRESLRQQRGVDQPHSSQHQVDNSHGSGVLIDEVVAWLHAEKAKKKARRSKRKSTRAWARDSKSLDLDQIPHAVSPESTRRQSDASDDSLDLEKLESILERGLGVKANSWGSRKSSRSLQRYGSRSSQVLRRQSTYKSSDTEYYDDDKLVPSCDVILDNSKISASSGGLGSTNSASETRSVNADSAVLIDQEAWSTFKYEITRLAHTLKLKGWRQLPLSKSGDVNVERLSGALTNAVYVVSPPREVPETVQESDNGSSATRKRKAPSKLILRIYGPHVEHLIDRESELQVLRRLARKHIGPCLLGTFKNGRFEEFFNARPLRPQDMRVPETSKQIAKRMRELHDGIELLREERIRGPFVWRNWDKWIGRAEKLAMEADSMMQRQSRRNSGPTQSSRLPGFVCGTPWKLFRRTVEKYRRELDAQYESPGRLMEQLVFAHNDTQYGNILRLEPPGESPLLLPANQHKQLVVIDFEYANANVPGLEFANHFTEWCYNYHDPTDSFKCNTAHYPSLEEQYRFIRSYVVHHPEYAPAAPATPRFTPQHLSRSVSSLNLEARNPGMKSAESEELDLGFGIDGDSDAALHAEIQRLIQETRLWRIANSAQWVIWGILQARFPQKLRESPVVDSMTTSNENPIDTSCNEQTIPEDGNEEMGKENINDGKPPDEEEFDYLSYATDRAMFFWGDCLQLGLVTKEVLGEEVMKDVKILTF